MIDISIKYNGKPIDLNNLTDEIMKDMYKVLSDKIADSVMEAVKEGKKEITLNIKL